MTWNRLGIRFHSFDHTNYADFNSTTDASGTVEFILPQGDYRFRADYDGVQFWSGNVDHCAIPGCEAASVAIPGGLGSTTTTIDHTYDPLKRSNPGAKRRGNRLTAADYSSGEFFHYTYDAVGNRLTEETHEETNTYTYDIANRLTSVNGVSYTWDDNGNLLDDGASTYSYDHANRLVSVDQGTDSYVFGYNGLGDRLQQSVNEDSTYYTLDINRGLTQVMADGTNAYLYGVSRVGEEQPGGWQYHLGDALGSVRHLTSLAGDLTAIYAFEPFGLAITFAGTAVTNYAFMSEWVDRTGLVNLRARYFDPSIGRMFQPDPWKGDMFRPESLNGYTYASNNPVRFEDPSGLCPRPNVEVGGRVLCYSLFIEPESVGFIPGVFRLKGDGRSFQSSSDPGASRGYAWIDLDTYGLDSHENPSTYLWVDVGSIEHSTTYEASERNYWSLRPHNANRSFDVEYDLVLAGPLEEFNAAPRLNGTLNISQGDGYIDYRFIRDGFPWAEAYIYDSSGRATTLFQDHAVRGNPFDLFAIEPDPGGWACVAYRLFSITLGEPRTSAGAGRVWLHE